MFRRLQALGEDKFRRITDEFARGTPVSSVARLIQQEWGDCVDVEEDKLAKQLKRLHKDISNEFFTCLENERTERHASSQTTSLESSGHDGLDRLMELASIVKQRIDLWKRREREGSMLPELTTMMKQHVKLVVAIQKIRFDLGLDEYKLGTVAVKEDLDSKRRREQAVHDQIIDASKKVDKIFRELNLPESPDVSDITSGD